MKLNKFLAYLIPATVFTLGMASCSDFIDIDPENQQDVEAVDYTKTAQMYEPVVGAYSSVRANAAHWANSLLLFSRDGDMWSGRTDDQGAAAEFGRFYNYNNGFWALNNVWVTFYTIVRNCNATLEALDNYKAHIAAGDNQNAANYSQYCGEARTIRAWAYYQLVNNFGPVVILENNNQTDFTRTKVEGVLNYILSECETAMAEMEGTSKCRPNQMPHKGAVTYYTAAMVAAQTALIQQNWAKAEQYSDAIINSKLFSLYPDFYNLFKIPGKLCDESLFEIQVTDFGNPSGDYVGVDQWFNFAGCSMKNDASGKTFGGWGFMKYEDSFVEWAKNRGETVRFETSFIIPGVPTASGDVCTAAANAGNNYNGKGYLPYDQMTAGTTSWGRNNNVRVLRYAEVLLINAEAKVRNGKSGDAPFKEVRTRAKMAPITGVTVDQILDERRMELCSEWCARYIDLVRTGKAASVLGAKGWTAEKTYWPLPSTQIENIPDLQKDPK
ncbi:MAG: RagB/SusD family nutrient uptake outer membrane protein [Bacteroidales bacterium]|nr:RagB/SusD family nutrient uptake outer membrane protein [Bacteroidales bacterium]